MICTRPRGLHLHQAGILKGDSFPLRSSTWRWSCYQADLDGSEASSLLSTFRSPSRPMKPSGGAIFSAWSRARKTFPRVTSNAWRWSNRIRSPTRWRSSRINLRDHIVGLNLGRWDYMASLIHFNLEDPAWVLPDRNTIPHDVAVFSELARVDAGHLPQTRDARNRRNDGALPVARGCRAQRTRPQSVGGRQEERSQLADGRRLDGPSGSERDCCRAVPHSKSGFERDRTYGARQTFGRHRGRNRPDTLAGRALRCGP